MDKDDTTGEQFRYLEAAPENIASKQWASSDYLGNGKWLSITTSRDVGTGMKNTDAILAKDSGAPAAKACRDATWGNKTDWFLPSEGELLLLWENRHLLDEDLAGGNYWSSSQSTIPGGAYFYVLKGNSKNLLDATKDGYGTVRAIRAF